MTCASQTLSDGADALLGRAASLRECFEAGGKLLASAMAARRPTRWTLVADLRHPPPAAGWPPRRALDLTEDTAIITAVGNDVGIEEVFQRQVIAYGRAAATSSSASRPAATPRT